MVPYVQEGEEESGEEAEEDAKAREPKKKTLRPPGYKRPPPGKKKEAAVAAPAEEGVEEEAPAPKKARRTSSEMAAWALPAERTVGVRESTRQKVQDAEEGRKIQEAVSYQCSILCLRFAFILSYNGILLVYMISLCYLLKIYPVYLNTYRFCIV